MRETDRSEWKVFELSSMSSKKGKKEKSKQERKFSAQIWISQAEPDL